MVKVDIAGDMITEYVDSGGQVDFVNMSLGGIYFDPVCDDLGPSLTKLYTELRNIVVGISVLTSTGSRQISCQLTYKLDFLVSSILQHAFKSLCAL